MKNQLLLTLTGLIGLTLLTGLVLIFEWSMFGLLAVFFMTVAGVKFYLVAFEFMELAKANRFWKVTLMAICFLILTVVSLLAI
ncbi:hypothetical protein [Lunatibacter salilacus]|uniref:hypothetical protein n=1 Tax=Lunatibacter salilacus TaxID=2483804 RepID=UPI00131E7B18|nr:hypothetical protein [Lunatibacter salilacus]